MQLKGLKDEQSKAESGQQFSCPNCAASLQVSLASTKSLTCKSCNSIIDVSQGVAGQLSHALQTEPVAPTPEEDEEAEEQDFHPVVIAETKKAMQTFSVSEAVVDLDLTGAPVVVFRHAGSGRVNMVYRRSDGNIGWIDPPALGADGSL